MTEMLGRRCSRRHGQYYWSRDWRVTKKLKLLKVLNKVDPWWEDAGLVLRWGEDHRPHEIRSTARSGPGIILNWRWSATPLPFQHIFIIFLYEYWFLKFRNSGGHLKNILFFWFFFVEPIFTESQETSTEPIIHQNRTFNIKLLD